MDLIDELDSSELGTKEYWDKSYENGIKNYQNHGDVGEIWFNEDSQIRIIDWILKEKDTVNFNSSIIDIGCGNGMFLIELARENFVNLFGCDYSQNAIELAKNISKDQNLDIKYFVIDMLNSESANKLDKYDIIHDKGTYDAIGLNPENPREKRKIYIENISKALNDNGYFVITSCNWTEDELIYSMEDKFIKYCTIPTPQFKFGGKVGNIVTSVVFKKNI